MAREIARGAAKGGVENVFGSVQRHVHGYAERAPAPARFWERMRGRAPAKGTKGSSEVGPAVALDWERRLHDVFGVRWPCDASLEFQESWPSISARAPLGGTAGRRGGDLGFWRALWCVTRHLKPELAVDAGVGDGLAARLVLEALDMNRAGRLLSVGQPQGERAPAAPAPRFAARHALVECAFQRALAQIETHFGQVDLCIHDAEQGGRSIRFELEAAWSALRPGGALLIDNVGSCSALQTFLACHGDHSAIIAAEEPGLPGVKRVVPKAKFAALFKNRLDP